MMHSISCWVDHARSVTDDEVRAALEGRFERYKPKNCLVITARPAVFRHAEDMGFDHLLVGVNRRGRQRYALDWSYWTCAMVCDSFLWVGPWRPGDRQAKLITEVLLQRHVDNRQVFDGQVFREITFDD